MFPERACELDPGELSDFFWNQGDTPTARLNWNSTQTGELLIFDRNQLFATDRLATLYLLRACPFPTLPPLVPRGPVTRMLLQPLSKRGQTFDYFCSRVHVAALPYEAGPNLAASSKGRSGLNQ